MLDLRFIQENEALIRKDLRKRGEQDKEKLVEEIVLKSGELRKLKEENDALRNRRKRHDPGDKRA